VAKALRVVVAVAMLLPLGLITATSAGAAGGTTCKSFSAAARLTPGLPPAGNKSRVRPAISLQGNISGCRGTVTSGRASATLKFASSSNCTMLVTKATANVKTNATGTLKIAWSSRKTSTIALSLSFGAVPQKPSLATIKGSITAGLFKGMKESGTVGWTLGRNECFGGASLTALTLSGFAPVVIK